MRVSASSWNSISALLFFRKTADKLFISANSTELGKAAECQWNAALENWLSILLPSRSQIQAGKFPLLCKQKMEVFQTEMTAHMAVLQLNNGTFPLNPNLKAFEFRQVTDRHGVVLAQLK